jgi:hypothetical protein
MPLDSLDQVLQPPHTRRWWLCCNIKRLSSKSTIIAAPSSLAGSAVTSLAAPPTPRELAAFNASTGVASSGAYGAKGTVRGSVSPGPAAAAIPEKMVASGFHREAPLVPLKAREPKFELFFGMSHIRG